MVSKVSEYIGKQESPQKGICRRLRAIIRKTFPGIKEEMKMGVPWYEGKYYIVALRDHVNMGFCIGGLSKAELRNFEGAGKLMRHVKFFSLKDVDEKRVVRLLKMVKRG
jgi:hypothetical protein